MNIVDHIPGNILSGTDVLDLPTGSWVVRLDNEGAPVTGLVMGIHPDVVTSPLSDYMIIKVAHVDEPKVGETITRPVLRTLPAGSIVTDGTGDLGRKQGDGEWESIDHRSMAFLAGDITVLRIGPA